MPLALASADAGGTPIAFWRILLMVAATWYVWAAMTPTIAHLAERQHIERPLKPKPLAIHAGAALFACAIQALTATIVTRLFGNTPATFSEIFSYWLLTLLPAGVIVYAAVVGLRTSQVNRARLVAREQQAQELARQLSEVQLKTLRSQIQPHFLFNTLNAVIALVRDQENARAVEALTTLSALLRTALQTRAVHEITLGDDLAFTANYLAIEQMRFGDRLTVNIDVPEPLREARVPTFLLQPFVENAVRHGLRSRNGGGCIDISARANDHSLSIGIEDDGAGLAADWEERSAAGFGISSSRARLAHLYGDDAALAIGRNDGRKGTRVDISLPLRRES
jgi:sensor histidine kinase YesM